MAKITFGTSGWRAIIAEDFTFENVSIVAQAIANYLAESKSKSIVIGYDTRFLSEKFAHSVAEVTSANKLHTFLAHRDVPTPVIAFEILRRKSGGGINITASHNPPEYNGIKFSSNWGGPATTDVTKQIEKNIQEILKGKKSVKKISIEEGVKKGNIEFIQPYFAYFKRIKDIVDFKILKKLKKKIVVDCFYGTGRGYLDELLSQAGCSTVILHSKRDVLFGGKTPEPSGENLQELIATVKSQNAVLGLAMDGDADRFGIVDRDGTYLTSNEVLVLLFKYLVESRNWKGCVVRTIATTHLIDAMASKYNVPVRETPVGFKYIGEIMTKEDIIIGGEESGGLSVYRHIPEKDGILACLLIAELVAAYGGKTLKSILKEIHKEFGTYYNSRMSLKLGEDKKVKLLHLFKNNPPEKLGYLKVTHLDTRDGFKFILEDGNWMLMRFSGTEPLVRLYFEATNLKSLQALKKSTREIISKL
ncbi:MAG: phosphoglucomutase/phosphomannomutase family protein [Candidatus Firestonebacteria bacterium]